MFLLSLLDKILRLFGTSEQQLRWKRHLREKEQQDAERSRKNKIQHLTYKHKMCDACGEIVSREAKTCPYCEAPVASWQAKFGGKLADRLLPGQGSMTTILLLVNGLVFLGIVVVTANPWSMGAYSGIAYGANYGPLMTEGNEWWRLFSYNFVHIGGAVHAGFNLYALAVVGPMVEQWYGSSRATIIYVGAGFFAGIASHMLSPFAASAGASGAVLGLIGAGVAAGHLSGGRGGLAMRNALLRWFAFIVVIGLVVPGIDNAAHVGGFISGALLGMGLGAARSASKRAGRVFRAVSAILVLLCAVSIGLAIQSSLDLPQEPTRRSLRPLWNACEEAVESGDNGAALTACDRLARADWFYAAVQEAPAVGFMRSQLETRLVAALAIDQSDPARARRVLGVWTDVWSEIPTGLREPEIEIPDMIERLREMY